METVNQNKYTPIKIHGSESVIELFQVVNDQVQIIQIQRNLIEDVIEALIKESK